MTPHPLSRFRALLGLLLVALCFFGGTAAAEPGAAITGLVRDTAGNLLPGTQVRLRLGNLTTTAQADADGVYRFSQLPAASGFTLRATHRRYATADLGPFTVASGETLRVDFALTRAGKHGKGAIVGTVRNSAGRPVDGAQVEVLSGPTDGRVTTTRAGKFRLGGLQPGAYAVSVSAHSTGTTVLEGISVGERSAEVNVELDEADENQPGALFGTVKDDTGHPIQGALVEIVNGPSTGSTVTGDGGRYELGTLAAGTYALRATAEGYWGNTWDSVVLAAGQEVRVDFALHSQQEPPHFGSITGLVKNAGGAPLAGVHLVVVSGPRSRSADTNEEGRYTLPELLPGSYVIGASKEGYTSQSHEGTVVAGQAFTLNFELVPAEPQFGSITGQVKAGDGTPLTGAHVEVVSGPRSRSADTNQEGRYTLPELLPGSYVIRAGKDGYTAQSREATVIAGQAVTLSFELSREEPARGRLRGRITNHEGAGIAGATVQVTDGPSTTTNADGNYEMDGVLAGERSVRVSKDGYQTATRTGVIIHSGETTTLDVVLERVVPSTGRLVGVVRDAVTHAAIAGATVQVVEGPQATTGTAGGFELNTVTPGQYTVRVTREGYQLAVREHVTVTAGETTRLEIFLTHVE